MEQFRSLLPTDWGYINFKAAYSLEDIPKYSSLYNSLNAKVQGSFNGETTRIARILNPYLYLQYHLKKEEYSSRGQVMVRELLHDTAAYKIDSIAKHNLDYRYVSRVKYGKGVSFSPYPAYANRQSSITNGIDRAMIIADVLIGNAHEVKRSVHLPPTGYDTTISYDKNVYVKYFDNEYYPTYVVYYKNN